jgi:hypothetical protein
MTALSIQPPFPIITDIDGQPLEDGYIWIGVANLPPIGNPIAVYWDAALTQPAALPVRTRGGYPVNAGTPARLYVNSDYSIQVQNRNGSVVYSAPQATERYSDPVISGIDSSEVTFLQAGSGAVVRTAQSKMRDVVSVKDFGAVGDGVADDTVAIQNAATAAQNRKLLVPDGTYKITTAISLPSNIQVELEPNATITTAATGISILLASSKTNVCITGGRIQYTVGGSTGLIGAVELNNCTYSDVENVSFAGAQFAGVLLNNSSNCTVANNSFSATLGTHQDAADIFVTGNSNDNTAFGNQCTGTGAHGIIVQGPGITIPLRNRIISNFVNAKTTYGIVVYQVTAADNYTVVQGNEITGILGTGLAGASGSGIYIQTCGGSVIADNIVKDCCLNTTSATNAPAGISIAFDQTFGPSLQPVSVTGNVVNSSKWSGIVVSSARGTLSGNSVNFTDTANGNGILIFDASNLAVVGNQVNLPTNVARPGIFINTTLARGIDNLTVSNNSVFGGNDAQIFSAKTSAGTTISGSFIGNVLKSAGASALGLTLNELLNATISGNCIDSAYIGLYIQNSSNVRGAGNISRSGSLYRFLSGGTCSNVYFDDSNDFDISTPGRIGNTVTGVSIEQRNNASPGAGNWQVGDRIEQSVPVVGNPKGWRCTVAGNPGTWVSEGNL